MKSFQLTINDEEIYILDEALAAYKSQVEFQRATHETMKQMVEEGTAAGDLELLAEADKLLNQISLHLGNIEMKFKEILDQIDPEEIPPPNFG